MIWVDEAGEAVEENGVFRVRTLEETVDLPRPDAQNVELAAGEIATLIEPPVTIERLLVSEGITEHEVLPVAGSPLPDIITGNRQPATGNICWRETSRRIHLSIARPPLRALVDLAEFRTDEIGQIANALQRVGPERDAPRRMRLAEHVGAAVLPFAVVEKFQSAAPHDGKGRLIEERRVTGNVPPNWFRPSYRLRPQRAWFHLRVAPMGEIDRDLPEAVALLAPMEERTVRVLCVDRRNVYPTTIGFGRILGARPISTWYPYGAGSFGAEMML